MRSRAFAAGLVLTVLSTAACTTRPFICPEGTAPEWRRFRPQPDFPEQEAVVCRTPEGVAHGPFASWVGDALDIMGHFNEGELNGSLIYFDGNGQVLMLSNAEHGKPRNSTHWNHHGQKHYEIVVGDDGRAVAKLWYPDGTPRLRAEELDGEYHGLFETWYESGSRKSLGHYDRGRKVGAWRCWNEAGDQTLEVIFGSEGRLQESDLADGTTEDWMSGCTVTCRDIEPEAPQARRFNGGCSAPANSEEAWSQEGH